MFIGVAPGNSPTLSQGTRCHPHLLGIHLHPHCSTRNSFTFGAPPWTTVTSAHWTGSLLVLGKEKRGKEEPACPFKVPSPCTSYRKLFLGAGRPFRSMQKHKSGKIPRSVKYLIKGECGVTIMNVKSAILQLWFGGWHSPKHFSCLLFTQYGNHDDKKERGWPLLLYFTTRLLYMRHQCPHCTKYWEKTSANIITKWRTG